MYKVSAEKVILERLIIKYASRQKEAGLWNNLKALVASTPLVFAALTADQQEALAEEGFTIQAGLSDGHFGIVAGPSMVTHILGHHEVDQFSGVPSGPHDPLHGLHMVVEAIKHAVDDVEGKVVKGPPTLESDLKLVAEMARTEPKPSLLAQLKLPGFKNLLALNMAKPSNSSSSRGSGGSGGFKKRPENGRIKAVRG
jgi:hypothetical protein